MLLVPLLFALWLIVGVAGACVVARALARTHGARRPAGTPIAD